MVKDLKFFLKRGFWAFVGLFIFVVQYAYTQSGTGAGTAGIIAAKDEITGMVGAVGKLILAIGAVVGLIGGVRCYIKWNTGDQDVMKSVMGWGGACLFLVIVGLVIQAFFGIPTT